MKVVDMHCDTLTEIIKQRNLLIDTGIKKNILDIDIEKMKLGDYVLQVFAVYTDMKKDDSLVKALNMIDIFYEEIEKNKDDIGVVLSYEDILKNAANDKISAMLSIEDGACCRGDISMLRNFYRLGVRMMSLTWNYENELGYPNEILDNKLVTNRGLKEKGIEFIKEMENLGIIIDVSHLSDRGFYDILENTKKPFVASHSNARAKCKNGRNLTDEMIIKLAERGGVIGINYYSYFLSGKSNGITYIDDIIRHIKYISNIGGIECVALGSDFDGIDTNKMEMKNASKVQILVDCLKAEGFNYEDIERIFCKNALRVFKEII